MAINGWGHLVQIKDMIALAEAATGIMEDSFLFRRRNICETNY